MSFAAVLLVALRVAPGILAGAPTADSTQAPASGQSSAAQVSEAALPDSEEPLYVSPTRLDRIGRILAPVMING